MRSCAILPTTRRMYTDIFNLSQIHVCISVSFLLLTRSDVMKASDRTYTHVPTNATNVLALLRPGDDLVLTTRPLSTYNTCGQYSRPRQPPHLTATMSIAGPRGGAPKRSSTVLVSHLITNHPRIAFPPFSVSVSVSRGLHSSHAVHG
jgi:hypothetical protein